jgi:hypothetical protein
LSANWINKPDCGERSKDGKGVADFHILFRLVFI